MKTNRIVASLFATGMIATPLAYATNGMNLAGYGPVSESMGGVSMAYDNGVAAAINNPATLGFMASGTSRLDVALGDLMPDAASQGTKSSATNFFMPAFGYVQKNDKLAYGVGMMGQGGMGTQYSDSSIFGTLIGTGGVVVDPGLENMSEVGVMRVMLPLAYNMTDNFTIGGSIDYVSAGMDVQWLMDGAHFMDSAGGSFTFAQASGDLVQTIGMAMTPAASMCGAGAACINRVDYGYFDFNKSGTFAQAAKGTGYAHNVGFTFKANPKLTIGAVYHSKTRLGDMKTSSNGATMSMQVGLTAAGQGAFGGAPATVEMPVTGQVTIKDFQWPETYGFGLAYEVDDQWNVMADFKRIKWAQVMKNFTMNFHASDIQANATLTNFFGGKSMDFVYYQNWKDQEVIQLGASYKLDDSLTLRFGGNFANNPIPDDYVSPLFPAVMRNHYTAGAGYKFSKNDSVDGSFVYAPKVTVKNNWSMNGNIPGANNQEISLGGMGWQVMYSHLF